MDSVSVGGGVMSKGDAFGRLTVALNEGVNLAPFVTSFSTRLIAS